MSKAQTAALTFERFSGRGVFIPSRIAVALLAARYDIACSAGLGRVAVARKERIAQPHTQKGLRGRIEIIDWLAMRSGSPLIAYAWRRSARPAGFSGQSGLRLV